MLREVAFKENKCKAIFEEKLENSLIVVKNMRAVMKGKRRQKGEK